MSVLKLESNISQFDKMISRRKILYLQLAKRKNYLEKIRLKVELKKLDKEILCRSSEVRDCINVF
jgi:hypothetical protein